MRYERVNSRPNTITMHGASCPFHCVCNGTHLRHGCWCNASTWKPPYGRAPWFGRRTVLAFLFGGGRAPGRFDRP